MERSKGNETDNSDDEFQDAVGDPVVGGTKVKQDIENTSTSKEKTGISNEDIIEELIRRQEKCTLPDEDEPEDGKNCDDQEDEAAGGTEIEGDDTDDEQALIEMEKVLDKYEMQLRKEHAGKLKQQGNDLFKKGEFKEAIAIYSEALQICPTTEPKDRAMLNCNRAAAKLKMGANEAAIKDCTKAINVWPEYVRAYLRRAKVYQEVDKLDEALADYKEVYKLDPGNHEAREALVRLPPIIEERNEKMKAEMVDKLKDLGNMILKPFGLSTSNFQMEKNPETGSYSINFKQK